jgi:NDP-sugar pyrophosphorylase family protein
MKAVILAGGGTKLKRYKTLIPKPLIPVGEKAVIDILLTNLKINGVEHVYICIDRFAPLIMAFLGDGSKHGLRITYSIEEKPLGTVAPLKLLKDLPDNFLVMNGDLLTDICFSELFNSHLSNHSKLTISTYLKKIKIDFGVLNFESTINKLSSFQEKPIFVYNVCMGVYVMNKKILEMVPNNKPFGFDSLILKLLEKKIPIHVFPFHGCWFDLDCSDDIEKANELICEQ